MYDNNLMVVDSFMMMSHSDDLLLRSLLIKLITVYMCTCTCMWFRTF